MARHRPGGRRRSRTQRDDVAASIKQSSRLRKVPVLMLAGAFEPVDQERVRAMGARGYW